MKELTEQYPTIIEGVVEGTTLRMESLDGSERYFYFGDIFMWAGVTYNQGCFHLKNFGPIEFDGKTWGVTHIQKKSKHGFLKVLPSCFHEWVFWKLQQQDQNGKWLPGTEKGIYFRRPYSWRWDVAGTKGKHWIRSWGYLGGHFD